MAVCGGLVWLLVAVCGGLVWLIVAVCGGLVWLIVALCGGSWLCVVDHDFVGLVIVLCRNG